VAARILAAWGWKGEVDCVFSSLAPLCGKKRAELRAPTAAVQISHGLDVLDGLLCIRATGEPRRAEDEASRRIHFLRRPGAWVLAIDLPSGLNGNTGVPSEICVQADLTATIAAVKRGLVADSATKVVGRLAVVPLTDLSLPEEPAK